MNPNIPFILKIAVDLFVGREITKDGPDKVAANAQLAIDVSSAVKTAASDPLSGVAAIEAILTKDTTDPAKLAALQTLITWAGSKAAALQVLAGGSAIEAVVAAQIGAACDEATAVAQRYLAQAGHA